MDIKTIKVLIQEFDASSLSAMKIKHNDFSLELEKSTQGHFVAAPVAVPVTPTVVAHAAPTPAAPNVSAAPSGELILSPMVGTFYGAPSPDSAPFVKVGDKVKKGQVIAILEAMKIMNELEAEFDCKIVETLVSDGRAVEFDMPLFRVEKL